MRSRPLFRLLALVLALLLVQGNLAPSVACARAHGHVGAGSGHAMAKGHEHGAPAHSIGGTVAPGGDGACDHSGAAGDCREMTTCASPGALPESSTLLAPRARSARVVPRLAATPPARALLPDVPPPRG